MEQRVNFFSDLNRPVRDWMGLPFLAGLLVVVALFYGAVIVAQVLQQRSLQNELTETNEKYLDVKKNYDKLVSVQQKSIDKEIYIRRINALTAELSVTNSIVHVLMKNKQHNKGGFSSPLKALASHSEKGLWLQRIQIKGDDFMMAGSVKKPESLPAYLEKLKAEPYFEGKEFESLEIKKDPVRPKAVYQFILRSTYSDEVAP